MLRLHFSFLRFFNTSIMNYPKSFCMFITWYAMYQNKLLSWHSVVINRAGISWFVHLAWCQCYVCTLPNTTILYYNHSKMTGRTLYVYNVSQMLVLTKIWLLNKVVTFFWKVWLKIINHVNRCKHYFIFPPFFSRLDVQ